MSAESKDAISGAAATRKVLRHKSIISLTSSALENVFSKDGMATTTTEPLVLIALDCSGSMADSYPLAANGCRLLEEKYFQSGAVKRIEFCTFGETVKAAEHRADTYGALMDREARRTQAELEASTCLSDAVRHIQHAVLTSVTAERPCNVAFLTDGCETRRSKPELDQTLTEFAAHLTKYKNVRIDCIGFTPSHDVSTLNRLVNAAPGGGSFQYAQTGQQLPEVLQKLALVQCKQITARLWTRDGKPVELLMAKDGTDDATATYEGSVVSADDAKTEYEWLEIGVVSGGSECASGSGSKTMQQHKFSVQTVAADEGDLLAEELDELVQTVTQLTNRYAKEGSYPAFKEQVLTLEANAETFRGKAAQVKNRDMRRSLLRQSMELKEPIASLIAALRSSSVQLQGDRLASLLSGAHTVSLNRSLAKRVDKRIIQNLSKQSAHEKALAEAIDRIKAQDAQEAKKEQEGQEAKTDTSARWGDPQCVLTLASVHEAPLDGDCLALCLSVGRSPATAVEPSLIRVHNITQTYIAHNAFLEGVEDALIRLEDEPDAAAQVVGDFKGGQGSAFRLLAHEQVNAALPLYISERHWAVARHKIHEAMSLACVGNHVSGAHSQVTTVPFVLLMHALQRLAAQPNDHHLVTAMQILETCQAIMRTWNLVAPLQETIDKMSRDPLMRTMDVVPSYTVVLAQLLACRDANPRIPDNFYACVVEEVYRRTMDIRHKNTTDAELAQAMQQVLAVDLDKYATPPKVSSLSMASHYGDKVRAHFKQAHATAAVATLSDAGTAGGSAESKDTLEYRGQEVCDSEQVARLAKYCSDLRLVREVVLFDGWWRSGALDAICKASVTQSAAALAQIRSMQSTLLLQEDGRGLVEALACLRLPHTPEVLTALIAQSLHDHVNATRRHSIDAKKTYRDPFAEPMAVVTQLGQELVAHKQAELAAAAAHARRDNVVDVFRTTTDLMDAAGCVLQCRHFGDPLFRRLFRSLQGHGATCAVRKWHMLTSGEFSMNGITMRLLNKSWNYSRRNIHLFRKAHGLKA